MKQGTAIKIKTIYFGAKILQSLIITNYKFGQYYFYKGGTDF